MSIIYIEPPLYPHPATAVFRIPGITPQRQLGQPQESGEEEEESETAIAGCPARCGSGCRKVWGHQGLYKEEGEHRPKGKMKC